MRPDCRHFSGSAPCVFHKRDGRACERCGDYEAVAFRILIVKLAAAGDVLRTTCILPALHRAHPGAQITWVTERQAVPLLEGNPLIDRIVARDSALERLMVEEFDLGLGLDVDAQAGAIFALARCRSRAGYVLDAAGRVMPVDARARDWWLMGLDDSRKQANRRSYPDLLHEICGMTDTPARPSLFIPPSARVAVRTRLAGALGGFDRVVVLNTGGGRRWAQKKWTPTHALAFARLVRRLHPTTAVVLAGGPDERQLNAALLGSTRDAGIIDAGCDNSVHEFAAILELADLVVTSDSLALHIATALARPVVALVGPTSPWELEMYGTGTVVTADVPCVACYRAECDKPVTCMELLTPERVYAACAAVLGSEVSAIPSRARPTALLPVRPRIVPLR
jgi:ADP-heptose:LPS heptosyltransferase